jgi:glycosyltransferase involved in cell wall biosynthesis
MISLIVATYNRKDELLNFLSSLPNTYLQYEVLIIDQNDTLDLSLMVSDFNERGMDIRHLKFIHKNLSMARNYGILQSKYEFVGFPDDDCWYNDDTIKRILENIIYSNSDVFVARWQEHDFKYPKKREPILEREIITFTTVPISSITLFFRKSILTKLNGFEKSFGVGLYYGAGEETDLVIRAANNKAEIMFSPDIIVHHRFLRNGFNMLSAQQVRQRERGVGAIYIKNNLRVITIIKGLVAPLIKMVVFHNHRLIFWSQFVGRCEGMISWKRKNYKII